MSHHIYVTSCHITNLSIEFNDTFCIKPDKSVALRSRNPMIAANNLLKHSSSTFLHSTLPYYLFSFFYLFSSFASTITSINFFRSSFVISFTYRCIHLVQTFISIFVYNDNFLITVLLGVIMCSDMTYTEHDDQSNIAIPALNRYRKNN